MNNDDFITLLQGRRHDYLNQLQIVQGYLSMNKYTSVRAKLDDIVIAFRQEQKLFNLHVPNFTLFILQFNYINRNIRLTYDIHIENQKLTSIDDELCEIGNKLWKYVLDNESQATLYTLNIHMEPSNCNEKINISFVLEGFNNEKLNELTQLIDEFKCFFTIRVGLSGQDIHIQLSVPNN